MSTEDRDRKLADMLEQYHRQRAMGEPISMDEYRETAGDAFDEFCHILEAEAALDASLASSAGQEFPLPFGAYTLIGELGRGAMGVVYEAIHRNLGRKVALKILRTGFDTHPKAISRFEREARACAQVRHDNIVKIYEAGQHDGRHFYAMELLPGKSLYDLAQEDALPSPRDLALGIAEVADALHTLHEQGIVHRDIKPGNIMVEPSGRMILADFGLARTVAGDSLTQTGECVGTPLYMSPEQLLGKSDAVNARSDIYALGATLYELLEGRPLFRADDLRVLMRLILKERPEAPVKAPEDLGRIILKALEKENADRYEDAAALRDDLRAFARGDQVEGRPLNSMERGVRIMRRHGKKIIAGSLAVAAVFAGCALQPPAPAQLTIASVPSATVFHDGESKGDTTIALDLAPGDYAFELRRPGYRSRQLSVSLAEGDAKSIDTLLLPEDPTDPDALRELAAAFDLQDDQWDESLQVNRASDDAPIHILLPRGDVRAEDLTEFRFKVSEEFEPDGAIVFESGGKELFRQAVNDDFPSQLDSSVAISAEVKSALAKGAKVTWGYHPKKGRPVTASFKVVDPDLSKRLARIEERLAGDDPVIAAQLRARLFLSKGLAYAAYQEAVRVADSHPDAVQALAVMRGALQKMDLKDGPLWTDLSQRLDRVSGKRRK